MRKVLVAGGSSFTGSNIIKYFNRVQPGFNMINLDRYDGTSLRDLPPALTDSSYDYVKVDLRYREGVWHHSIGTELIINCVWSDAGAVPMQSNDYVDITLMGLNNLLQSARARNTSRFVQVSTADVYGPRSSGNSVEGDVLHPLDLRSGIRAAADTLVWAFAQQWDLGAMIVRPTNLYGPNMSQHELLPQTLTAIVEGRPVPKELSEYTVRDWLSVDDFCSGIDVVTRGGTVKQIYNIASESPVSDYDLVDKLSEIVGRPAAASWKKRKGLSGTRASAGKLRKLGWEPKDVLFDKLPEMLELYTEWRRA